MAAKHTPDPALLVRRLGQQGVSSRTLPGWHTLGFGHGRGETIAYVKNDLYANLYAAAPDLLAALRKIAEMGPENDEWDAVARYEDCRKIARAAIARAAIARAEGRAT